MTNVMVIITLIGCVLAGIASGLVVSYFCPGKYRGKLMIGGLLGVITSQGVIALMKWIA